MSQYTSFVAVDAEKLDKISEPARPPRRMVVPVPLPEGTSWEGFFGESMDGDLLVRDRLAVRSKTSTYFFSRIQPNASSPVPLQAHRVLTSPLPASRPQLHIESFKRLSRLSEVQLGKDSSVKQWGGTSTRRRSLSQVTALASGFSRGGGIGGGGFGGGGRFSGSGGFGFESKGGDRGFALGASVVLEDSIVFERMPNLARLSAEQAKPIGEAALSAFKAANQFEKDGKLAEAREEFMRAYLLDAAMVNTVRAGGQIATEAVAALDRVHAQQVKAWTAENPTLAKRLDLVIRDKSLAESLEMLKAAAGIEIELLAGSTADAALMRRDEVRVNYLDLRGATVAQALDWILHPQRMSWRSKPDGVIAGTDRRQPGTSAWVYDVSLLLPLATELKEAGNDASKVAAKAAETLVTSLRTELKADDPASIAWFSSSHLLVVGDVDRHASVDKWIDEHLSATLPGVAKQRRTAAETTAAALRRYSIANAHTSSAWRLLAAAAGGELDVEALTELQIAWRSKHTAELLDSASAAVILRSLWCVEEAARALSNEAELTALATAARAKSRAAITAALAELDKNRDDASAFAAVLYAALAMRDDQQLTEKAIRLLTESQADDSPLAPARPMARVLLTRPQAADVEAIVKMIETGVAGQDMTVMLAIACRRAGGDAWSAFRREATDMLGKQPLAGSVLVLINRLNGSQLDLATTVE
jgi:hypothetical protein